MSDLPCGCELARRAERESEEIRPELEEQAVARQRNWSCPFGRHDLPDDVSRLPGPAQETLVAVETLTGARGLTTCPLYYVRQPHVAEACRARKLAEQHLLTVRYGDVPGVLLEAIELVDAGINARLADDSERSKQKGGSNGG